MITPNTTVRVPAEAIEKQKAYMAHVAALGSALSEAPLALVEVYGCQQNEADGELLRGMLVEMGYGMTADPARAALIILNTCAVRGHAEQRVFGRLGQLVHTKRANPGQIIALCGCMSQQKGAAEHIRRSYRHVDLVFGTHALWRFPKLLHTLLTTGARVFETEDAAGYIAEGLPVLRSQGPRAWLPVMYGCDNYCSYCVVPYVRGRERSRLPGDILRDAQEIIANGSRDITLLGQNVNSYGRGADFDTDFPQLLRAVCALDGEFIVRFMTSHPKDATDELFEAMAASPKAARHLHLPVQSGSDSVLAAMNRGYTAAGYAAVVEHARSRIPGLTLTSDVIVGFPGESERDFEATLALVRAVRFDSLYTFIYSPRPGTAAAAELPDDTPIEVKKERFKRLVAIQNDISAELHRAHVGLTLRVLVDEPGKKQPYNLAARTEGGRLAHLKGPVESIGSFAQAKITDCTSWSLFGEIIS